MSRADLSIGSQAMNDLSAERGQKIAAERARYDMQFGEHAGGNLVLRPDAEFVPNDLRAALLHALNELGNLSNARVLEIGAGTAWDSVILARRGAHVVETDISPVGVEIARRRFEDNGVGDRAEADVMAAEHITFPSGSFDLVFGRAVLHHIDAQRAPEEIVRVLKVGGRAVFMEPLSENPVLDFARDYLPYPGKKSPRGHRGVTYTLIHTIGQHFAETRFREFYFTSMLNRVVGHHRSSTPLETVDGWLVSHAPPIRRFCRYIVITYRKAGPHPEE
jgi:SAM-dependent methyltransferase